jgi:hypothetical protein
MKAFNIEAGNASHIIDAVNFLAAIGWIDGDEGFNKNLICAIAWMPKALYTNLL